MIFVSQPSGGHPPTAGFCNSMKRTGNFLTSLSLRGCNNSVSDKTIGIFCKNLTETNHIETLQFSRCSSLTDTSLDYICKYLYTGLKSLSIDNNRNYTDKKIAETITQFNSLTTINTAWTNCSDRSLASIAEQKNLLNLCLDGCRFDVSKLKPFKRTSD